MAARRTARESGGSGSSVHDDGMESDVSNGGGGGGGGMTEVATTTTTTRTTKTKSTSSIGMIRQEQQQEQQHEQQRGPKRRQRSRSAATHESNQDALDRLFDIMERESEKQKTRQIQQRQQRQRRQQNPFGHRLQPFRRAIKAVAECNHPIVTRRQAMELKGIGTRFARIIVPVDEKDEKDDNDKHDNNDEHHNDEHDNDATISITEVVRSESSKTMARTAPPPPPPPPPPPQAERSRKRPAADSANSANSTNSQTNDSTNEGKRLSDKQRAYENAKAAASALDLSTKRQGKQEHRENTLRGADTHRRGGERLWKVILLVDVREHRSEHVQAKLKMSGVPCEVRTLPIGDMLWIARSENTTKGDNATHATHAPGGEIELILGTIVERKEVSDLASSLYGSRYLEQRLRLQQSGIEQVLLLVEGDLNKVANCPAETLRTAMMETRVELEFSVVQTQNLEDSVRFLRAVHRRILQRAFPNKFNPYKDKPLPTFASPTANGRHKNRHPPRRPRTAREALADITFDTPPVPPFGREHFITYDELKTKVEWDRERGTRTLSAIYAGMLKQIDTISDKKVFAIRRAYPTMAHLMTAYSTFGPTVDVDDDDHDDHHHHHNNNNNKNHNNNHNNNYYARNKNKNSTEDDPRLLLSELETTTTSERACRVGPKSSTEVYHAFTQGGSITTLPQAVKTTKTTTTTTTTMTATTTTTTASNNQRPKTNTTSTSSCSLASTSMVPSPSRAPSAAATAATAATQKVHATSSSSTKTTTQTPMGSGAEAADPPSVPAERIASTITRSKTSGVSAHAAAAVRSKPAAKADYRDGNSTDNQGELKKKEVAPVSQRNKTIKKNTKTTTRNQHSLRRPEESMAVASTSDRSYDKKFYHHACNSDDDEGNWDQSEMEWALKASLACPSKCQERKTQGAAVNELWSPDSASTNSIGSPAFARNHVASSKMSGTACSLPSPQKKPTNDFDVLFCNATKESSISSSWEERSIRAVLEERATSSAVPTPRRLPASSSSWDRLSPSSSSSSIDGDDDHDDARTKTSNNGGGDCRQLERDDGGDDDDDGDDSSSSSSSSVVRIVARPTPLLCTKRRVASSRSPDRCPRQVSHSPTSSPEDDHDDDPENDQAKRPTSSQPTTAIQKATFTATNPSSTPPGRSANTAQAKVVIELLD